MSLTIEGVPSTITRKQFMGVATDLGFDPQIIRKLTFRAGYVTAEVVVPFPGREGQVPPPARWRNDDNSPVVHTVVIEVTA